MIFMTGKQKAEILCEELKKIYPEAKCSLNYSKPYELLFAVRLSAQCTDARVNIVTKELFEKYKTLEQFAEANVAELEKIIRPCGFFRTKSQNIKDAAVMLLEKYSGVLPDTIEELVLLPGIGRKTANLIVGDIYGKPAVVADTHCIRITGRIGLTDSKDPFKVEMDLKKVVKPSEGNALCHRLVLFGRDICSARSPKCDRCTIKGICRYYNDTGMK